MQFRVTFEKWSFTTLQICICTVAFLRLLTARFGSHPLQFWSFYRKKSSIPKGVFDTHAFSLKQMAEASATEGRQGNTSGPDQSVLQESALSGCIPQ